MTTPTRTTPDPFRGSSAVQSGDLTWDRLAGPDFRWLCADTYVGADAVPDIRLRVAALNTWSRERGIVAGPLAALAWGADCPWDDAEIVLRCHRRPPLPDVTVREDVLPDAEVTTWSGCRLTTPVRTAFDLARRQPLIEAVAAVDAVAHVCRFDAAALRRLADEHPGARGLARVRKVLAVMDPRAESLPETRLRLGLADRGVPPGVPQFGVQLRNGQNIRFDLAWPRVRFALEYQGPEHRTSAGQNKDAFRLARASDLDWEVQLVTSAMVLDPVAFDELAVRVLRRVG